MYRINERNVADKLSILLKQPKKLFHTADLALLWGILNDNTLYTTIKRYVQKGTLIPIQKGLYGVIPVNQLDPFELGVHILHRYAYISTESVLVQEGIINQAIYNITMVSDISKMFSIDQQHFLSRSLKTQFLYNTTGITQRLDGVLIARVDRAIADMLYFQPQYHLDADSLIDWEAVRDTQKKVGYE